MALFSSSCHHCRRYEYDEDHLDHYSGIEEIKEAFLNFLEKIPFSGLAVLCLDHAQIQSLIPKLKKRFTTYGLTTQADFQAKEMCLRPDDHIRHSPPSAGDRSVVHSYARSP